jgi:RNA polymerase sigma factor for flagellar operon FliA
MVMYAKNENKLSSSERNEIFLKYIPLLKFIAGRIAMRLPPHIDINDIISAGALGLIDAVEKFDETKGIKFKTYAEFRVWGAMLDSLRNMDWVSRSVRKSATVLEKAFAELEKRFNRPATDEEIAEELGVELDEVYDMVAQANGISLLSLEMISAGNDLRLKLIDCLSDENLNPLSILKMEEVKDEVAEYINELPGRERMVVSLYYYNDLTMKEVSEVMEITESRVSQLHSRAIIRLRGKINTKPEGLE